MYIVSVIIKILHCKIKNENLIVLRMKESYTVNPSFICTVLYIEGV